MKVRTLVWTLIFLITVNVAFLVVTGIRIFWMKPGLDQPRLPREIAGSPFMKDLDDDTKSKIRQSMMAMRERGEGILERVKQEEEALFKLYQQSELDTVAIYRQLDNIADLRHDMARLAAREAIRLKAELPADVFDRFYQQLLKARPSQPGMNRPMGRQDRPFPGPPDGRPDGPRPERYE